MFTGLKSVIYPSDNLNADKVFWETATGIKPYVDMPYYVGFKIGDHELGLDPNAHKEGLDYPVTYWNVASVTDAAQKLIADGATTHTKIKDVGGGMMMGTFKDLGGNIFGIIDDPQSNER